MKHLHRTKIKDVYLEEGRASEPWVKYSVLQHFILLGMTLYGGYDKKLFR